MNLRELIPLLEKVVAEGGQVPDDVLHFFSPINTVKLQKLLPKIEIILNLKWNKATTKKSRKTWNGQRADLLGRTFEKLVLALFEESKIFDAGNRVTTPSAEIDFLITINPTFSNPCPMLNGHTRMFGEGKCHLTTPAAEWINKLVGVMNAAHTTLGVIFVFWGPKTAPKPFREAIDRNFRGALSIKIVPFGLTQFKELAAGKPLVSVINAQNNLVEVSATSLKL